MVQLHSTRLMPIGEVALWHNGRIVWRGGVGATVWGINFDAISMHVEDAARISALGGKGSLTHKLVVEVLADWWSSDAIAEPQLTSSGSATHGAEARRD